MKRGSNGMNTSSLLIVVIIVMVFALIATFLVGFSQKNKEGNPEYEKKTAVKWVRLSVLYVAAIVVIIVLYFAFVRGSTVLP
jgi:heme/copper-type cytochrome/quinol oxidase subunit 2